MQRCLQLAALGAGEVAPNPLVGAVLVYDDTIIGEGYHKKYGKAHAEVNCINSVEDADKGLIEKSTMYVSLEPCAHFGKTPPCVDQIISKKIPNVVIGCRDSFAEVNGKGIGLLKAAGLNVIVGILEDESRELNKRFFTFYEKQRPYIILKWAQSCDGKIAPLNPPKGGTLEHADAVRLLISNEFTNRLVHKWRSEESSILVGTNTAQLDDPALTTRLWQGKDPVRLVIDKDLKLLPHLKIFDNSVKTIVFNYGKQSESGNIVYRYIKKEENILTQITESLYNMNIQSVLIEGGTKTLQSFIDAELWDEARVISNEQLIIGNGVSAPVLKNNEVFNKLKINQDTISFYRNEK